VLTTIYASNLLQLIDRERERERERERNRAPERVRTSEK
jgi:hypothetical protein